MFDKCSLFVGIRLFVLVGYFEFDLKKVIELLKIVVLFVLKNGNWWYDVKVWFLVGWEYNNEEVFFKLVLMWKGK